MHLYLGESPRTLYLITSSQEESVGRPRRALVFRASQANPSQAIVEFLPKDEVDITSVVRLTSRSVKGCLGLISVGNGLSINHKFSVSLRTHGLRLCEDLFVAVVTASSEIGNIRSSARTPENVSKIHEVAFYSLTSSMWDDLAAAADTLPSPSFAGSGSEPDLMSYRENTTTSSPIPPPVFEHPCVPLTKILSSGSFYYASGNQHWDLSTRLQERLARDEWSRREVGLFDERFVWNEYIVRSLLDFRDRLDERERDDFDRCQFVVSFYFAHPCLPQLWRSDVASAYCGRSRGTVPDDVPV